MLDLIVIGGGAAGYAGALRAAQLGGKVLLVEMAEVGGTCLHRGCVPSKVLYEQAALLASCRAAIKEGLFLNEPLPVFAAVTRRQKEVIEKLHRGLQDLLIKKGVTVIKGRARVKGTGKVLVSVDTGQEEYVARNLLIASGSVEKELDFPGAQWLSGAEESLTLPDEPCRIVVIGGGVTGLELAGAYASFAFTVTVVEKDKVILPTLQDEETSKWLAFFLKKRGLKILTGTIPKRLDRDYENGKTVLNLTLSQGKKVHTITAERIINATGRRPRLDVFAADMEGLRQHSGGIVVNEYMETGIKGIYAAGDVTGPPLLAHLAYHEGIAAAENAMGLNRKAALKPVPFCLSVKPGLAWVGLTESQAREKGIKTRAGYFPFAANSGAVIKGAEEGFVKIVAAEDGMIIGMQALGEHAQELIMEGTVAVSQGLNIQQLSRLIHPHPTMHEALWEACLSLESLPLHG